MSLYWILRLPQLQNFLELVCMSSGILFVIFAIVFTCTIPDRDKRGVTEQEIKEHLRNSCNIELCFLAAWFFFGLLSCFIPDYKQLAIMYAWDGFNSEGAQQLIELLKAKLQP